MRLHAVCVLLAKSLPSWQKTNLRGGILPKCDFLNIETEFEWHTCCRKLPELHKQFLVPLPKKNVFIIIDYQLSSNQTINFLHVCIMAEIWLKHVHRPKSPAKVNPSSKQASCFGVNPAIDAKAASEKGPARNSFSPWGNRNVVNQISPVCVVFWQGCDVDEVSDTFTKCLFIPVHA